MKKRLTSEMILINEAKYSKNNYSGDKESTYYFKEGKKKILLVSGHSTNHHRNDKLKLAELFTGTISEKVASNTDAYVLTKTGGKFDDPNYDETSVFRSKILEVVKQHNIQFLLDIHGAKNTHGFDVELGTGKGSSLNHNESYSKIFTSILNKHQLKVDLDKRFTGNYQYNISRFINTETNIPTIQIEISKDFRNIDDVEKLNKIIEVLIEIVEVIELNLNHHNLHYMGAFELKKSRYAIPINYLSSISNQSKDTLKYRYIAFDDRKDFRNLVSDELFEDNQLLYAPIRILNGFDSSIHLFLIKEIKIERSLKTKIEDINNDRIIVSQGLANKLQSNYIELYNVKSNKSIVKEYTIQKSTRGSHKGDFVWLDYYQRKILGAILPEFVESTQALEHQFGIEILEYYHYDENHDNYYFESKGPINEVDNLVSDYVIREMSFQNSDDISLFEKIKKLVSKGLDLFLEWVIGSKMMTLEVIKANPIEEGGNTVRVHKDILPSLGVDEGDIVKLFYDQKCTRARIATFGDLTFHNKDIQSSEEVLISSMSVPLKLRNELGLYSLNIAIDIQRDKQHVFFKHLLQQFAAILGLILTVSSFEVETIYQVLSGIVLITLSMFIVYKKEKERVKI